jgi:uncharacterized membrane-anchored protein YitT (DUF2179 family)
MSKKMPVWVEYLMILVGTLFMSMAIKWIYDPNAMVIGGFSGLSILIKGMSQQLIEGGIPLWVTTAVLNVPLFLASWKLLGKNFIGKSLFSTVVLSVWLAILPEYNLVEEDLVLAAVFGGGISGIGMGLIFLTKSTTGGTDMLASLIQIRLRHVSLPQIMQVIDGMIVLAGAVLFGIRPALYAIVCVLIEAKVSDSMIDGMKYAKSVYIITEKYEEVSAVILEDIDRGVTGLRGVGMYSKEEKMVLYCVVSRREIVRVKELVQDIDPEAFVIVSDAREVLGEGF